MLSYCTTIWLDLLMAKCESCIVQVLILNHYVADNLFIVFTKVGFHSLSILYVTNATAVCHVQVSLNLIN